MPPKAGLEPPLFLKGIVTRRIVLTHVTRDIDQLYASTIPALEIGEVVPSSQQHFTCFMRFIGLGVAADPA
jgi:hypothetical protein